MGPDMNLPQVRKNQRPTTDGPRGQTLRLVTSPFWWRRTFSRNLFCALKSEERALELPECCRVHVQPAARPSCPRSCRKSLVSFTKWRLRMSVVKILRCVAMFSFWFYIFRFRFELLSNQESGLVGFDLSKLADFHWLPECFSKKLDFWYTKSHY